MVVRFHPCLTDTCLLFLDRRCEFRLIPADFDGATTGDDLVLPESYEEPANNSIIIASAVVAICAILAIVVTVVFTGRYTESLDDPVINVPPISAFPPSPPKSMLVDSDVTANGNGSFIASPRAGGGAESATNVGSDGAVVDDKTEEHINELI